MTPDPFIELITKDPRVWYQACTEGLRDLGDSTAFSQIELLQCKINLHLTDFGLALACERARKYNEPLGSAALDIIAGRTSAPQCWIRASGLSNY